MIEKFRDHAANERTFLAWVRTSIALMAFGFLIEKFDLFLAIMAPNFAPGSHALDHQGFGRWAGLGLIVLGVAVIVIAAVRFMRTARAIERAEPESAPSFSPDIVLAVLLVLFGVAIILYLSHLFG
jgi:putative membrane protein